MIPGWRDAYVHSGNYSIDEFDLDLPQVVGFFGGYVFINLSNVRMQGIRSPAITLEQLDLAFFGDHPDVRRTCRMGTTNVPICWRRPSAISAGCLRPRPIPKPTRLSRTPLRCGLAVLI